MAHQILIASYRKDFVWLRYLLRSLNKYCTGFLPPVIVVTSEERDDARALCNECMPSAIVKIQDCPPNRGFLRAQLAMMSCDRHCSGDIVWLLGSDCFCTGPFSPDAFMKNGKPIMWMQSYEETIPQCYGLREWQYCVERVLGFSPSHEFMRRLPLLYPRFLYAPFQAEILSRHAAHSFDDFVFRFGKGDGRDLSESNLMGAYAYRYHPEWYEWVDIGNGGYPKALEESPSPIVQCWSHGGLDRPRDGLLETPRQLFAKHGF